MRPAAEAELMIFNGIFAAEHVVLRLTDQSPKERLLGMEIDMDYNRKVKMSQTSANENGGDGVVGSNSSMSE
jgi:hypothetical protein